MALVDALGNLHSLRPFARPQPSRQHRVEPLIHGLEFCGAHSATRPSTTTGWRANLNQRGAAAVIPSKADRASASLMIANDKWRHLVENFFCYLKAVPSPASEEKMTATAGHFRSGLPRRLIR